MPVYDAIALLAAGIGGGIAGTMASVASVVSYPALLALGLPPLAANVTNTMSLVFCVPGAVLGARTELAGQRPRIVRFGAVVAAGGALGAAILLLAAGFLIGGYAGQRLVRHLPVAVLRVIVALAGLALAVKLGISAYR